MVGKLRITQIKSVISHTRQTRATVRSLGLHRIGETVEVADTPELRGMARRVRFLVRTEEVADEAPVAKPARAARKKKEESK